ncbi:PREDICTED: dual specificity protein phosphatase 1 [Cyprinodon variegatus]|uniref:Dual specificity protein phosphatase n=1 Tax=Cyprinodon variegatus TaxID=28743 RepID=A0A3Q2DME0_CYPVA|nr:PREDICTED: dual specificity protein phosphatase 1 [Cyprinodon variegatus]
MLLDLTLLARGSTMVIMEVPTIDCASLRALLELNVPGCLVLDCRSFLSFNASHIPGSTNVRFSTIVRRRARGGLGLEHIVPNEDTRNRLLSGEYQSVVLLDERSAELSQAKKDGTLLLAVSALRRSPCGVRMFILQGGFDSFSSEYPEMCTKASPPQGLSLSLSARNPESADPNCSPCNTPLYDQGGPVEILPFLYLGSAYHASRKDMLDMLGITALINVSSNCPNHFEDSFLYKSIPVEDNHKADISSWFNEAIEFIDSVRNNGGRVFVHCQAGISRSATICLAYLMRTNRVKLDEAFEFVKQRRSIISPNFSFMGQLLQFESQVLASSTCSSEAGSPAINKTGTVFNFPVSIPVHASSGQLAFRHSPITTSPGC